MAEADAGANRPKREVSTSVAAPGAAGKAAPRSTVGKHHRQMFCSRINDQNSIADAVEGRIR